jgi:hypothetical protein
MKVVQYKRLIKISSKYRDNQRIITQAKNKRAESANMKQITSKKQ